MGKTKKPQLTPDTVMESRMGFINKYGVKGVVVLILSLAAPYLGTMADSYMSQSLVRAVKAEVAPLTKSIHSMGSMIVQCRGGVMALKGTDIQYIAKMAVAKQSMDKIREIRRVLAQHPNRKGANRNRIRVKIKEILVRNSAVYIKALNRYQHPAIGLVGDYIKDNFPRDRFLESIYGIVFVEGVADEVMAEDVLMCMLTVQEHFFDTMLTTMKAEEQLSKY